MSQQPSYYESVYTITRQIPHGRVTTYGDIANYLELGSARMVGWALRHCFESYPSVPAHRVVNRNGELSGKHHFATPMLMQALLENEGVIITENKVKHFKELRWTPK